MASYVQQNFAMTTAGLGETIMAWTRAGFWQRLGALFVDFIVLTAVIQVAAFVLYPLSNGRLQADGLVRMVNCQSIAAAPAGVTVPAEFAAGPLKDCRVGLLGLEYGHYLEVEGSSGDDPWKAQLDRSGNAAAVLSLDMLMLPLLMLWRAFTDGRSAQTLGRRAAGLKVVTGEDGAPGFGTALLRQLFLWWPGLLSLPFDVRSPFSGGFELTGAGFTVDITEILGLTLFVWLVIATIMIARRLDPLHDRWAGTRVLTPES